MERYYPFSAEENTVVAVNVYRSARSVPLHRHGFWELFLVVRGSCSHASEDRTAVLLPGDLCVIPPHTDHCFDMRDEVEIYNCQCDPMRLSELFSGKLWGLTDRTVRSGVIHLEAGEADYVRQRLDEILREQSASQPDSELVRRAALILTLVAIERACHRHEVRLEQIDQGKRACVRWAAQYIEGHLAEKLDFSALAAQVHLSEKYFRQVFKDVIGMPPVEYLNRQRVIHSLIYLQKGCSVSEAGARVGWEDANYYSRVFKRVMGYPPKYFK